MSELRMPSVQPEAPQQATPREWLGLVVLAFAVLLVAVDGTVLDLALPFISADLAPTSNQLLWIIDVYSFVLAGLLITMGTLGDRVGRRNLLLIGAAGFGIASVVAAFSTSPEMLIGARVLQGVSGATLMPATLGLIRTMFSDPRQRVMAIGIWGAMAGGGAAGGPLVGGWLLEHFWWGSVFLINIPVMIALIGFGPLVIPESKDPFPGKFDLVSSALSMLALVPLVYAVKETVAHGMEPATVLAAVVGIVSGVMFVRRQRRLADPMIDLRLFANPAFSTAVFTNFLSVFIGLSEIRRLLRDFSAMFPDLGPIKLKSAWAGMIDTMPDIVPVVDTVAALPGLTIGTGMSGHGFGIGPGMGRVLARLATGQSGGHDLTRFRLARFTDGSPMILGPNV